MLRLGTLLALITTAAYADAPKKPALSAADQKAYKAALKKGRELEGKKQFPQAIAQFEAALQVAPDDAAALAEIGWTAFQAKDLKRAEQATKKALANQAAPNIRGAVLFNLGMIREAQNDKAGAIAAYKESLSVRPNAIVRAQLAKLDSSATTAEGLAAAALSSPHASIDAYCKTQPKTHNDGDVTLDCTCGEKLDAPAAIAAFRRTCQAGQYGTVEYMIAIKDAAGFHVGALREYDFNRHCDESVTFKNVKADGAQLLVEYAVEGGCEGGDISDDWTERDLVIINTGKTPAMTTPLMLQRLEHHQEDAFADKPKPPVTVTDVALTYTWKDGKLELTGKTKGLDKKEAGKLVGVHTLTFP